MAHFSKLVATLAAVFCATAHAGYAQLAPPVGWAAGVGSQAPTYAAAANEAWLANTVRTSASLNVGGRAVTVPVSMRLAANAPGYLAGRIGTGMLAGLGGPFGIGLTLGAALVLPSVTEWIAQTGKYKWNDSTKEWEEKQLVPGTQYRTAIELEWSDSMSAACGLMAAAKTYTGQTASVISSNPQCVVSVKADGPYAPQQQTFGYLTRQGNIERWNPTTYPIVQPNLAPNPFPEGLPNALPIPWPVQSPVINPSPGANPAAQPLFVPTGNPVPNPNYNPQQAPSPANQPYLQPGVRVVPIPTPANPWQVDVQPVDKPTPNADGSPDPATENPEDPNKPVNKDADLCEKNPDILACQKLDKPDSVDLPEKEIPITVAPDSGWGASDAQCPAPRYIYPQGKQIAIPFTLFCQYMSGIRPIILAMAWLGAAFILIGAKESS